MSSAAPDPLYLHAYGQSMELGARIECADCGLRRESSSATLPPCPSYSEATHERAGWLMPLPESLEIQVSTSH